MQGAFYRTSTSRSDKCELDSKIKVTIPKRQEWEKRNKKHSIKNEACNQA